MSQCPHRRSPVRTLATLLSVLVVMVSGLLALAPIAQATPPSTFWGPSGGAVIPGAANPGVLDALGARVALSADGTKAVAVWVTEDQNTFAHEAMVAVGTVLVGNITWGTPVPVGASVVGIGSDFILRMTSTGSEAVVAWSDPSSVFQAVVISPNFTTRAATVGPLTAISTGGQSVSAYDIALSSDGSKALASYVNYDPTCSFCTFTLWAVPLSIAGTTANVGSASNLGTTAPVSASRTFVDSATSADGTKFVLAFEKLTMAPSPRAGNFEVYALAGEVSGSTLSAGQPVVVSEETGGQYNDSGAGNIALSGDGNHVLLVWDEDQQVLVGAKAGTVAYSGVTSAMTLGAMSTAVASSTFDAGMSADALKATVGWAGYDPTTLQPVVKAQSLIASGTTVTWEAGTALLPSNGGNITGPSVALSGDGQTATASWFDDSFIAGETKFFASMGNIDNTGPAPTSSWANSTVLATVSPPIFNSMAYSAIAAASPTKATTMWLADRDVYTSSTPWFPPPTITATTPATASTGGGSTIVLTGTGLANGTITVGGTPAAVTASAATSLTFTAPALAAGPQSVVLTDINGQTANTSLNYVVGPTITSQPADDTRNVGQTATFSVSATASSGALSYQWQKKPSGGSWGNVSGGSGGLTNSYTTPALASGDDSAQYRVVVTDSNGSTTSNAATLTVISPPGAPNQPTVTSYGNATATVAVTAGSGGSPTSYTVTPSPLPSSSPTTCTVTGSSGSCSFSNLTNGTAYTFSATATNTAGTSSPSSASSSITPLAPPGQPGAPTAVVTGATSATVTITPPGSGGPPATYTVTPSPAPGSAPTTCTVTSPATSCAFSNLTSGTTYTFTSTATNVGGTSSASPASASTQISAPGTPGTPSAVAGPASATVTIVAGSGGPATTYTVTASGVGGQFCTVTSPATSCVVPGLTAGTPYTFTSTATNGAGTSSSSSASNSVTPTANVAPGTPGIPTAVASNGGATVTVVAPGSGGTPTSYTVTPSPLPSSSPTTCTVSGASGSCSFSNLTNGVVYTFTSTATNGADTSASSLASAAVTPMATPGAPGAPSAVVTSTTSATVTISPPVSGGAPATYTVTSSPAGGTCTVTAPATSCLVTGLTAGQTYTFSSTATNVGGTSGSGPASTSITLGLPGVPGAPTAIAGVGSATVSITPPGSGGTPSIYTVTSVPAGGTCTVTPPATSCVVTGLSAGTSYTFTSTATNGAGTSGASAASNAVTPTSPTPPTPPTPVPPSAPGTVSVTAASQSVNVSWTVPANPGSSSISTYRAVASPGGASCLVAAPATSCTIAGLTNGTAYTVSVSALSGAGWGAAATSAQFIPGANVPATPAVTSVLAGNGAATVSVSSGSGGGAVTSYLVTASPGGSTCTVIAPANNCVVTGLTNGVSYTFTATATGPGGTSGASATSPAVIPVAPITPTPMPLPAPLNPGQAHAQQGGQTVPVTVAPNGGRNAVVVTGPDFTMDLQGEDGQGNPLPLSDGVLVLEQDRTLRTSGTGFFPNSEVSLYLDPPSIGNGSMLRLGVGGTLLGSVRTDALGDFDGTVQLDASIGVGEHVVQAIGVTQGNTERALSLGVIVDPWIVLDQGSRKPAGMHDRMRTTGTTGGIDPGTKLTPHIKYSGQASWTNGKATITVRADGSFTWSRLIRKNRGLTAYVSYLDTDSNQVFWAKVR